MASGDSTNCCMVRYGACAVGWIVGFLCQIRERLGSHFQRISRSSASFLRNANLSAHDPFELFVGQRVERYHLSDAVVKFGPQAGFHDFMNNFFALLQIVRSFHSLTHA